MQVGRNCATLMQINSMHAGIDIYACRERRRGRAIIMGMGAKPVPKARLDTGARREK